MLRRPTWSLEQRVPLLVIFKTAFLKLIFLWNQALLFASLETGTAKSERECPARIVLVASHAVEGIYLLTWLSNSASRTISSSQTLLSVAHVVTVQPGKGRKNDKMGRMFQSTI